MTNRTLLELEEVDMPRSVGPRSLAALFLAVLVGMPVVAGAEDEATKKPQIGVGARVRYVWMSPAVLNLFLDHSTSMSSVGAGLEVVRRRGNFDIVFGFEYENVSPQDGLYLEQGDDPGAGCLAAGTCPDYVDFDGLALLGVDASFIWHARLAGPLQLRYGAGIGIAAVLGDAIRHDTSCPAGTTIDDLDDPAQCSRLGNAPETGVPPVVPIVNVLLGLRYPINPQLSVNLDGGFRDVFFLGLGTTYVF